MALRLSTTMWLAVAACALAPSAHAATARVVACPHKGCYDIRVHYVAAPGEHNRLAAVGDRISLHDGGATIRAGGGCTAEAPDRVTCGVPWPAANVSTGDMADRVEVLAGGFTIDLGSHDDELIGGPDRDIAHAGDGRDVVHTLEGDDSIFDGDRENDELDGGPGDDRLIGGEGADNVSTEQGRDRVDAGGGDDAVGLAGAIDSQAQSTPRATPRPPLASLAAPAMTA